MNKIIKICSILCLLSIFLINSCSEGIPINLGGNTSNGVVKEIKDQDGGTLEKDGYEIQVPKGSIPLKDDSSRATVSFSIELGVVLPAPARSSATQVGRSAYFAPEGFVFNFPMRLFFPCGSESPFNLYVFWYNDATNSWENMPKTSYDSVQKRIGIDVYELGTFVILKRNSPLTKIKGDSPLMSFDHGGVACYKVFDPQSEYTVVTIESMTYKNANRDSLWYGNLVGKSGRTWWFLSSETVFKILPMYWELPFGSYSFWISRVYPDGRWETYNVPLNIDLTSPLIDRSTEFPGGWYPIDITGGGTWLPVRPNVLKKPTKSVGTGELQLTLKWQNTLSNTTDLDLHLLGPNDMEVCFYNKKSSGGEIELDRDWMHVVGSAIENIYSLKTMPSGHYKIFVQLFSGVPKSYTIRVKRGSYIRTYSKSISVTGDDGNQTIEEFNK